MAEAMACIGCQIVKERAKLLRCLHAVCPVCVERFIGKGGCITCPACGKTTQPSSAGVNILQTLPNAYCKRPVQSGGAEVSASTVSPTAIHCEECGDDVDTGATCKCIECAINLCDIHGKAHQLCKSTRHHQVAAFQASSEAVHHHGSRTSTTKPCPLHNSQQLITYCWQCEEILCKICLEKSNHRDHRLVDVAEASSAKRQDIGRLVQNDDGTLLQAVEHVSQAISTLHEHTENVSEEIQDFFKQQADSLKKRESELLDTLDKLRYEKLEPLESQKNRLQLCLSGSESVTMLLESCSNDVDMLRMSDWLEHALKEQADAVKKDAEPHVSSNPVFRKANAEALENVIGTVGAVTTTALDATKTTLHCTTAKANSVGIVVRPRNANGDIIFNERLTSASESPLQVTMECPGQVHVTAKLAVPKSADTDGQLVAVFTDAGIGRYVVSVQLDGEHVSGSPASVDIYGNCFDPERCSQSLLLSNNHSTVCYQGQDHEWHSVCGRLVYTEGQHTLRIRVDALPLSNMFILLCNSPHPAMKDAYNQGKGIGFGWYGHNKNVRTGDVQGGSLGQPWAVGDVIRLILDADRHTLTGVHERSGQTGVISDVTGPLYLMITLFGNNQQVTLLD